MSQPREAPDLQKGRDPDTGSNQAAPPLGSHHQSSLLILPAGCGQTLTRGEASPKERDQARMCPLWLLFAKCVHRKTKPHPAWAVLGTSLGESQTPDCGTPTDSPRGKMEAICGASGPRPPWDAEPCTQAPWAVHRITKTREEEMSPVLGYRAGQRVTSSGCSGRCTI